MEIKIPMLNALKEKCCYFLELILEKWFLNKYLEIIWWRRQTNNSTPLTKCWKPNNFFFSKILNALWSVRHSCLHIIVCGESYTVLCCRQKHQTYRVRYINIMMLFNGGLCSLQKMGHWSKFNQSGTFLFPCISL